MRKMFLSLKSRETLSLGGVRRYDHRGAHGKFWGAGFLIWVVVTWCSACSYLKNCVCMCFYLCIYFMKSTKILNYYSSTKILKNANKNGIHSELRRNLTKHRPRIVPALGSRLSATWTRLGNSSMVLGLYAPHFPNEGHIFKILLILNFIYFKK